MSQWSKRAGNKTTRELELWVESLDLRIKRNPDSTQNLVVKRRWILEIIEGRRQEIQEKLECNRA